MDAYSVPSLGLWFVDPGWAADGYCTLVPTTEVGHVVFLHVRGGVICWVKGFVGRFLGFYVGCE